MRAIPRPDKTPRVSAGLEVRDVPGKGRGLLAARRFAKGSVVESTPVIVIPADEWVVIEQGVFGAYCFWWDEEAGDRAFAVGWTSFLNHSYSPNVFAQTHADELRIEFRTLRTIEKGEELTLNYNGEPDDLSPVGFDVVDG